MKDSKTESPASTNTNINELYGRIMINLYRPNPIKKKEDGFNKIYERLK